MYGAGSYSYYTTAQPSDQNRVIDQASPVKVDYAPGLGYSINATTGVSGNQQTGTLANGQNDYLTITNSTNLNDNTAIQVPKTVGSDTINADETITISGTRPMSVWYTVGTSAPTNPANNIYVPDANKLVGTNTTGAGGNNAGAGGIG